MNKCVIEKLVGTKVNDLSLYVRALTHKSYNKECDYERLEFIGDAVLKFIVTKYLFEKFPTEDEGFLTRARTKIERSSTLARFSRFLNLGSYVLMDEKGYKNNWNQNESILEDVFEAIVGALYLDKGMIYARDFVLYIIEQNPVNFDDDNFKDQMMRFCQLNRYSQPEYSITQLENGTFKCNLSIDGVIIGYGIGKTKKSSEQSSAQNAIKTNKYYIPKHVSKSGSSP
jgi:ribonuclease-3